jgi:phosphate-selective porin OprO and OprP
MRRQTGLIVAAAVAVTLGGVVPARARDLLDVLEGKGVLSEQEVKDLRGTSAEHQPELIELLRKKGVLTENEAADLAGTAPPQATVAGKDTERRLAGVEQKVAEFAKSAPVSYDDGFVLRTGDGRLSIKLNGRVSSNFFFFEPNTTQTDTQTIDRARLGVEMVAYKYFKLRFENDFSSSSGLRDAYLAINYLPEANLQVGQYKTPFSFEQLRSKRYVDFVERAAVVSGTVDPSRDIGIMVSGELLEKVLQYQVAGMNGAGQNTSDNNSDKDLITRLMLTPFAAGGPEDLRGLSAGGAFTWGRQGLHDSIEGKTESGFVYFASVPAKGLRWRAGGDLMWFKGPYSVSAEYIQTEEARDGQGTDGADLPDVDTNGAYVGGTWLLTGETKPVNRRMHPSRPFLDLDRPGWGAWELAARYEFFTLRHGPDSTMDTSVRNRYDGAIAGVNWYPNEFLRFSLDYLYSHFENLSPNPDKHSNSAVLSRVQFEF